MSNAAPDRTSSEPRDPVDEFLSTYRGTCVLDMACGDGDFTHALCDCLEEGGTVVGVDTDGDALEEARETHSGEECRFELGDARDLRYADGTFDIVAISNGLHHVPQPPRALREARRVLSAGGVLIVHEMTREVRGPDQENARELHHLKARVDRLLAIPHNETLPSARIHALIEDAGFTIRDTHWYEIGRDSDPDSVDARIEFIRDYIQHVCEAPEFASIRKNATMLVERIRIHGFAPPTQVLIAAVKS